MPAIPSQLQLQAAVRALRQGGVIACPTEAVWGLSCDPNDGDAVAYLLALKHRPMAKGLILVAASEQQIDFLLTDLSAERRQILSDSWPGPATWLLPHYGRVPAWVCGEHATVAVRVSAHPVVSALCAAWGGPLVSTSANPAGARPARESFQVRRYFGNGLDYIVPGRVGAAPRPTVIRDLCSGEIVRQ
ncbi:MAG: Sua5/YciO/YrdC/YwlC family protein [Halioglobus sp.]